MSTHGRTARRFGMTLAIALLTSAALSAGARAEDDAAKENPSAPRASERAKPQRIVISNFRPHDARGLNVFEAPKAEGVPYDGFQLQWGAAFTQQLQSLDHENTATPNIVSGVDVNRLIGIGTGFNNATANLYMNAQLARGMRVALTSYLSSRHHSETWVKDGYLLVDGSPWENETLDKLMEYVTLRLGHFEIDYGDMHFRRTDNGQAMFNPLVGNLLMDAFTTEVGGEAYFRKDGLLAMVGVTGGEVRGQVAKPEQRAPSYLAKLGIDREIGEDLRLRLTGSLYTTEKSVSNTLYTGSRAGSRYYYALENVNATEAAQAWSGDVQPGFGSKVTAWVVNPFVRFRGLELFGNIEQSKGRRAVETADREWSQYAGEGLVRFCQNDLYVVGRYNVATGRLQGFADDVTIERTQVGGGWFIGQNVVMKAEYVQQTYRDFPASDLRNGGKFDGLTVEGVISF